MEFCVDSEIFKFFPGIRFVCVAAEGINPEKINTEAIEHMLREGWKIAGQAAFMYGNPQFHPNIKPWVARLKAIGVSRKKFPNSIESMVRRAGKGGEAFHIIPLVDFYNSIALSHIVPAGGFDIDQMQEGLSLRLSREGDRFMALDEEKEMVDFYNSIALSHIVPAGGFDIDQMQEGLSLRLSREGDRFMALDEEKEINVPAGEVSYADGNQIVTRQFVWKQAKHLLLNEHTKNVFFVSEILGDLPYETADNVAKALVNGLWKCFDISTAAHILDERNTHLAISE